jgi:hypothetical protein
MKRWVMLRDTLRYYKITDILDFGAISISIKKRGKGNRWFGYVLARVNGLMRPFHEF